MSKIRYVIGIIALIIWLIPDVAMLLKTNIFMYFGCNVLFIF